MEISYIKDGNQNIMIIKDENIDENDYKLQMIINNKIEGLVPLSIEYIDNSSILRYDLSSRISFAAMYARKRMTGKELYGFIKDIKIISDKLREYLIDIDNIMFDTEYIFFNRKTGKYEMCYRGKSEEALYINIRTLFDRLLEYIDHEDKEAVLIAYGIQQLTISGDFTMEDILQCARDNVLEYKKEKEEELKVTKNIVHLDENKCEDEIEKRGIINILKKFFKKKSKYKTEDELEALKEFDYLDENENSMVVAEESNVYRQDAEEGTTILSLICPLKPIRLTAIGTEIPINIVPNHYPYLIGKSRASCDFCIDSSVISRVHLRVSEEIDGYTIEDLNSTNGTFLNGEKLKEHEVQAIKEGDRISLANLEFVVE